MDTTGDGAPPLDWVVDADAHVTEPGDVWLDRVPAKFRELAPRMERDALGSIVQTASGEIAHVGKIAPPRISQQRDLVNVY